MTRLKALSRRAEAREATAVAALLLAVFVVQVMVAEPIVGVGFLYVAPVIAAALWFGRLGGLLAGVVVTGRYVLGTVFVPQEYVWAAAIVPSWSSAQLATRSRARRARAPVEPRLRPSGP